MRRFWLALRLVALAAAIVWGIASTGYGVYQQRVGLAPSEIDCSYRADLLRDRIVADLSTTAAPFHEGATSELSTLLRETLAACTNASPDLIARLSRLDARYRDAAESRLRLIAIRQEVLAHE